MVTRLPNFYFVPPDLVYKVKSTSNLMKGILIMIFMATIYLLFTGNLGYVLQLTDFLQFIWFLLLLNIRFPYNLRIFLR